MKINELLEEKAEIDEALADFVPGTAGNKARKASTEQQKRINQIVAMSLEKWAAVAKTITASGQKPTPAQVVQWLTKFMGRQPTSSVPTVLNNNTLKQWLTQEIAGYIAQKELPPQNNTKQATAPSATPAQAASQPTQTATAQPSTTQLMPGQLGYTSPTSGISVKQNRDPWILTYKGKNFMLNDSGYWALDGKNTAGAQASAPMQTEFDRVAGPGFDQTGVA